MTNNTTCPDCGVGIGQPHINDCDCEGHSPLVSAWNGIWPGEFIPREKLRHKEINHE